MIDNSCYRAAGLHVSDLVFRVLSTDTTAGCAGTFSMREARLNARDFVFEAFNISNLLDLS